MQMVASNIPSVPSVERVLTLFEFLAHSRRGFSLSEISQKLKMPKSSVHLLVTTLERRGYLQKNLVTGQFRFGLKLLTLSRMAFDGLELREEARPFLSTLVRETGLTSHMAILEGNEAVVIEKIEAPGLVKIASWVGRRMEINCTSLGKALVAYLPEEEFDRQFKSKGFIRHNQRTIISISKLKEDLARVRDLRYSIDDEEEELGCRCIGAPIFDIHEKVVAAISVSGTTSQIPIEKIAPLAKKVRRTADTISAQLGCIEMLHT
jgi:DNA-binding IclR family transcriptional regulator